MLSYKSIVITALAQSFVLLLLAYVGFSDMKSVLHNIIGIIGFAVSLGIVCFTHEGE